MPSNDRVKSHLYERLVRAKLFAETHHARRVTVNAMAAEAYLSRFHFLRLFKRVYSRTPHQYLTAVRIERAKALLDAGAQVTHACYAVGFESLGSFTALFRKVVGINPSEYRGERLARRAAVAHSPLRYVPGCIARNQGWIEKSNF